MAVKIKAPKSCKNKKKFKKKMEKIIKEDKDSELNIGKSKKKAVRKKVKAKKKP